MTSFEVRPLSESDIAALQQIDRASHGECWSQASFLEQIEHAHFCHLVAVGPSGAIIGHASSWTDGATMHITNVATSACSAGQGVATRLLICLLLGLGAQAEVALEVRPRNHRAQRLYRRLGFAPIGTVRDFYGRADEHGSRDALAMRIDNAESLRPRWRMLQRELAPGSAA